MSDSLARALAAPAPAAQPMGNQDMLARILMGTPDPRLPQYPGIEQAAPLAPTMRTGLNNDMWRSARIAEALRNDVNELFAARDPSRNYGTILPISSNPNAEGSTRFDLKGGLTGDLLAMLGAGGRAMRGEEYNPMDITTGMMTVAAPSLASRSSGVLHSAGGSARDGIRAYHGSPHQFDRFDMSRIGTGEGAQAYGHGLYFAGNEGVARSYRDALSPLSKAHGNVEQFLLERAGTYVRPEEVMRLFQQDDALRPFATPEIAETISRLAPNYSATGDLSGDAIKSLSRLDTLISRASPKGSMYEVRLNTTPDRLLDWDAPLSRQPQAVRDALARVPWGDAYVNSNLTGGQIMPRTAEGAQQLREAGIPGIQYLDAGSRAAGDGTRNYVMFDDSLIDILRRYGLAGILAGGAASQAQAGETAP